MRLEEVLQKHFGFSHFRPGQKEIISSLLNGEHTLAMLPTGSGKSLCYQLPAYLFNKSILVISPLLSLMQDQAEQLKMRGEKRVLTLNSFLTFSQKQQAINELDHYRFIFLSPEMLALPVVLSAIKRLEIGLFVIDEAHCISQWGYDFRPDYLNLGLVRKQLGNPLTLALTATATEEVRLDIKEKLGLQEAREIISSVDRSNIAFLVEEFSSYGDKLVRLEQLLTICHGPVIVYFSSKKTTEAISSYLQGNGFEKIGYYHGGMEQEQRMLIQQQFLNGQLRIICATSAFGMGVNKENVRAVIHFHLPGGMESYLQEIGRAGRDGKQSAAILLYSEGDEGLPVHLQEQQLPTDIQIEEVCSYLNNRGYTISELSHTMIAEIMESFSLTDTQWRWMDHFIKKYKHLLNSELLHALKQLRLERNIINQTKLERFFGWRKNPECRRNGVLDYFQEKSTVTNDVCCDRCGVTASELLPTLSVHEKNIIQKKKSWKHELGAVLGIEME
jgi:ATP-dependent DNA helicase RecQ